MPLLGECLIQPLSCLFGSILPRSSIHYTGILGATAFYNYQWEGCSYQPNWKWAFNRINTRTARRETSLRLAATKVVATGRFSSRALIVHKRIQYSPGEKRRWVCFHCPGGPWPFDVASSYTQLPCPNGIMGYIMPSTRRINGSVKSLVARIGM